MSDKAERTIRTTKINVCCRFPDCLKCVFLFSWCSAVVVVFFKWRCMCAGRVGGWGDLGKWASTSTVSNVSLRLNGGEGN